MIRIDFVQGSDEWKAWRNSGVGASDCPTIMMGGKAKIEKLKSEKWGGIQVYETPAMKRGKALEPAARHEASKELLCKLETPCFESLKYPGMLCSLDGWFDSTRTLVEIKCPGPAMCERVASGDIPPEYDWQIQHQIAITDALEAYLAVYDGKNLQMVSIARDEGMIERLVSSEMAFLTSRIDYNAPDQPQVACVEDKELESKLDHFWRISAYEKELIAEKDAIKAFLKDRYPEPRTFKCGDHLCQWNEGRDIVDYKSVPQLQGVDTRPYTKKGTGYWKIT